MKILFTSLLPILILQSAFSQKQFTIFSPKKDISVEVSIANKIYYSVKYKETIITLPSSLSLELRKKTLGIQPKVISCKENKIENTLKPVWGKATEIANNYTELVLTCEGNYAIEFRVYDDGMAYRFCTTLKDKITVVNEVVDYQFNENFDFYFPENEGYESKFALRDFYSLDKGKQLFLPLALQSKSKLNTFKILLTEADVIDYPSLILRKSEDWLTNMYGTFKKYPTAFNQGGYLDYTPIATTEADFIALTAGTRTFPWRAMVIVSSDKELLNQDLVYKLAKPSTIKDWSWVQPGLCAWEYWTNLHLEGVDFETGQNKNTYEYYINYATTNKIPYMLMDWKWSHVHDFGLLNKTMDLPYLMKLAKEKNVKIVLWTLAHTLYNGLEKNLDEMKKLGASGVKVDFFDREDQLSNQMYERIAAACAQRQMIVDFHGCAKPSGLHKAYPNILNYEAVMGNEYNLLGEGNSPLHHLHCAFIRGAIGPFDYTPGGFRNTIAGEFKANTAQPQVQGTRANQMAMFIAYEAGLQMLCDSPTEYTKSPELFSLLTQIPKTWDKTIALDGNINEYLLLARKSRNNWYLAAMTNGDERTLMADLSFLGEGNYKATMVCDGINANKIAKEYKITTQKVTAATKLVLKLAKGGGAFVKVEKEGV